MGQFGTGQAIRRVEDQRFLTGTGTYTDDVNLDGQLFLCLFRSPYAHGSITTLEVGDARNSPGVVAVYTAVELHAAGVRDVTGADMPASSLTPARDAIEQPALARDKVRYVGEPVAAVVATSLAKARDAAELIEFDVDEIDPVISVYSALLDDAALVHDGVAGNSLGILEYGDKTRTDKIFASANTVAEIDIVNNRLAPTAMEPRGCIADYDLAAQQVTLYQGCQGVHALRDRLLHSFDLRPEQLHVISPDVGGAFGLKFFLQCETVVAVFAAMDLARPVKWTADRTESFLADLHGRDHVTRAQMALDNTGHFLAMKVSIIANTGAYCSQAGPIIPWFGACMTPGCYDIESVYVDVQMALTNTVPVDAYRGAGRPEAAYAIERLVDEAARQSDIGVDEIRRRNFIRPEQFPYRTATGRVYDSGNYEKLMNAAMQRADWQDFASRRESSAAAGKLRGIGLGYYVEICSAMGGEDTHISIGQDGRVTILMGTQSSGQGHETCFAQMVASGLGIAMEQIDVVQGDSKRIPTGEGTGGSRSMAIGGSSLFRTVDSLIDSGRKMAAELLEAAEGDIEFSDGRYRVVGTDHSAYVIDVGIASYDTASRPESVTAGLYSTERFAPDAGTFPNGCHICELEIDPATGDIEIINYVVEDDVGVVVNPLILEGQIMGGVAQGLGQAMCEHAVYEADNGQLLTATFMDYAMPRADRMPDIRFNYQEVASPRNPLGIKGAGEAGTVGAAPALVNAAINALAGLGIYHLDMPLTPMKMWHVLREKLPSQ
jgi:carbon-monoxide dehydrogenase large subunit